MRHAFAVDPPESVAPTDEQRQIVDRICHAVVSRRMTRPALLYLEVARPLNYLGSQALHFFQPVVSAVLDARAYEQFARFLEHRGSVDYLVKRIEHFETERHGPEVVR
jgi:hypothetical protein